MCGIALIVNGVSFDPSFFVSDSKFTVQTADHSSVFSDDDIEFALRRRGPDSLGASKLFLKADPEVSCFIEHSSKSFDFASANGRTPSVHSSAAEFRFVGTTLQLRGTIPIAQPLVDKSNNILVYNGEIFGGLCMGKDDNDAENLLRALENCSSLDSDKSGKSTVVELLSRIRGPWAFIYWQERSKTLWFGRDAFGRRSLLVHWPTAEDSRFLLSSVSPFSHVDQSSDSEAENGSTGLRFWEELPCGIYSTTMVGAQNNHGFVFSEVRKHEWTDELLNELIKWERISVEPKPDELDNIRYKVLPSESVSLAKNVLEALRKSVCRRSSLHSIFQVDMLNVENEVGPVAVLFSGGLDSMILSALLNECLDSGREIDLLNVSFDGPFAPDRISAKAGLNELRRVAPSRKWKLVEIDSSLSTLTFEVKHVTSLITPANTYMDINIGIALWLAAGGDGWVSEGDGSSSDEDSQRVRYKSKARILLVGSGADEQCAGYGRHRTKYRNGSWHGLNEEMKLDMQRIWKRNLGRDDRCIADNGKEARFPFLDEDVIKVLLDIPLWEVTDLDQPSGVGDKKILRQVAHLLGLYEAASLPKRAIQFGSRIARESNRKNFGSNRAANQASAGSVLIQRE